MEPTNPQEPKKRLRTLTLVRNKPELRGSAQERNHPQKGSSIKVDPIRNKQDVQSIKKILKSNPRNFAIFVLGINSALRAGDLLKITIAQVQNLKEGDYFQIKEQKEGKYRFVTINKSIFTALQEYLKVRPETDWSRPLFLSREGRAGRGLTVSTLNRMVKSWCRDINLEGNYGSHSLRKTWGYHQRVYFNTPVPILTASYNHSTQKQTMDYLGIQAAEVYNAGLNEI